MAVDDCIGNPPDPAPTDDALRGLTSEQTILVFTDSDRPVEHWVGDGAGRDVAVVGPECGAEFGLEADEETVVASVDPADGARSTRLAAPIDREQLLKTIDRLDRRVRYDALLAEYARLAARRGR